MSRTLGLDTSSVDLGIGLYHDTAPVASFSRYMRYSHAEHIAQAVAFIIKTSGITPDRIDRIAVVTGPGSFTGLRIGIAFVKGFCIERSIPVLPVSSLQVMAQSQKAAEGRTIVAAFDARNNDVFTGSFVICNGSAVRKTDDTLENADRFRNSLPPDAIIITDTQGYSRSTVFDFLKGRDNVFPVEKFPMQRGLICAETGSRIPDGSEEWRTAGGIVPNYLRPSAAQVKAGL